MSESPTPMAARQADLALAHRLYAAGQLDAAWSWLSKCAIDPSDPRDAPMLSLRGMIRRQRGETAEAVLDAQLVCTLIADDPIAWYNLGVARERAGLIDEAADAYRQALARAPEHYAALYNLGTILLLHQDAPGEAAAHYGRAYDIRHDEPRLLLNYSLALVALNRHESSKALMDQLIDRGGAVAAHYCVRGLCNYELGQHAEAMLDYEAALKLDPNLRQAQYNKALLLLLQGDYGRGLELYEAREDLVDMIQVSF